jgi:3-oxoacyl-[acyl-carrier protein] reductase
LPIDRLWKMKLVGRSGEASEIAHTANDIFKNEFSVGRVLESGIGM